MYKNRILISLGLVAGLTFLGVRCFATSTGVVNTETARMRAEASTTSNIVALVSQDEKVEILDESGDWYKVNIKIVLDIYMHNMWITRIRKVINPQIIQ